MHVAKPISNPVTTRLCEPPLAHPQSICSVLSGLHLRVALSGCIDVLAIRLLRPPRHACFAALRTLHLN